MNHQQLLNEADELFDNLDPEQRQRFSFRWSYVWNHTGSELVKRFARMEKIVFGSFLAGIVGLIIAKALGM